MSSHTITLNNLPNAAMLISPLGKIIEINSSFADILKYSSLELVNNSIYELVGAAELQTLRKLINDTRTQKTNKTEVVFYSKEKYPYTLELYSSCLEASSSACEAILIQAVNVTHYKRVNEELKEQRRFHKTLLNNLPGVVYRCKHDQQWTMEYISQNCEELTGYRPEDFIGSKKLSFGSIIHPDHKQRLWDQWQDALEQKQGFATEYPIINAEGKEIWVWEQGVGVFDSNDRLLALEGIIFDISDRKKTEEALRDSESRFRTILQSMPILLNAFDDDGNIVVWNKACEESTEYSASEMINNPKAFELLYPDPNYRKHVWNASLDPNNRDNTYDLVSKSGEIRTVTWFDTYHYISFPGWSSWGIGLDITDQKKVIKALRDSEEKFRMLVDNAFDGIYLMRNRKYEYANQRFTEITGYTLEELSDDSFDFNQLLSNVSKEMVEQRYKDRTDGKDIPNQYELQIISKEGVKKEVEISTASLGAIGDVMVLGIMRDITDRKDSQRLLKENEEKLKRQNEEYLALNEELIETNKRIKQINADLREANQRAEEHDKLKSAFLANMSHEVRTPMNGILGFSQLLLDKSISYTERDEFVGIIQNCGNQLLAIINDLIDISKIEANLISLNPKPLNINDLINEQFLLFKPKATNLNLDLKVAESFNATILVDGTRLRQVLSNLIGNALKFTREGTVAIGFHSKGTNLEFYVKDTGVGIPENKQSYIFERFRQVETDLARQAGGTGLGLAISKALVNKMGGEIWVESNPNQGSTFYFTIPFSQYLGDVVDQPISDKRYQSLNRSPQILIADDNEVNYIYLKELLKDLKPSLSWATNGLEAVEMVKNNPEIDLILMDIKMPVMDGYEATRELKKFRKDLPIIAQTAYAMSSDRDKATEAGCDDYIAKPISRERFLSTINRYLKKR